MAAGKIFAISFALNAVMGANFSSTMSRSTTVMQGLNAKTAELNAAQKRLDREWQNSQNAVRGYTREMQRIQTQYDQGKISQSQYQTSMSRISQNMRSAGMSAGEYRSHLQRLAQEMEHTRAAAQRMQAAQAAKTAASANLSSAWAGMKNTATTIGMAAAPLVGAVETAATFEAAMSKVQAITGITDKTDERMQALTATARKLGETTQFSATQAAQAMSYLGMAGWNAEQIMSGMPGLLSLAAASGTDLARTADIVSDDLTAFGLSADQAGHMADVFAVTVTHTNTTVEMLGETMKYAAPVAKAFGASMEETAAMAGLMANAGVKSSQAGTALRAGFLRLAGPPKKSRKAMAELGISMSEATAQQEEARAALNELGIDMDSFSGTPAHKMVAVLAEIRNKTQNLTGEQKLATMQAIFGTEAATGWLNVIEAGPEAFDSLVAQMENCDGAAEQMAKTMLDNTKGALTQLKSALEGLGISIGSIFLPALTTGTRWLAEFTGSASAWVSENEALVAGITEVAAGVGTAIFAVKAYGLASAVYDSAAASVRFYTAVMRESTIAQALMTSATQAQTRASAILNTAMNGQVYRNFANQALAAYSQVRAITWGDVMTAASTSAGEAATAMRTKWQLMKEAAITNMQAAKTAIITGAQAIKQNALLAGQSVMKMGRSFSISNATQAAGAALRGVTTSIMGMTRASLAFALSPLGLTLMAIAGAALLIYQNWGTVGPFFMSLWGQIQAAFSNAWAMIQPAIEQFWQACVNLGTAVAPVLESLWQTVQNAWAQITAVFAENQGTIDTVINIFTMLAEVVGVVLVGAFIGFVSMSVGVLTAWIGMISSVITGAIGVLTGIIEFITGVFTGNWTQAWQGIVDIFSSIFSTIGNIANSILGGIQSTISSIANSISNLSFGGGGTPIAQNARGGIYRKGAFLTTFAEEGPEAAIPLDGSPRAIGLWQKAGEILGVGQKNNSERQPAGFRATSMTSGVIRQENVSVQTETPSITMPPVSITVNVYGDENPNKIRQAVIDAGHKVQKSFAEKMEEYRHEKERAAFA